MSATLSLTSLLDNKHLFPDPPPILSIPARQHSLTIHFSRRTHTDYVKEVLKKVLKIHKRLPEGGVLVFLTGQREIEHVVQKLSTVGKKAKHIRREVQNQANDTLSAKQGEQDAFCEDEE